MSPKVKVGWFETICALLIIAVGVTLHSVFGVSPMYLLLSLFAGSLLLVVIVKVRTSSGDSSEGKKFDTDFKKFLKDAIKRSKGIGPDSVGVQVLGHGAFVLFNSREEIAEARKERKLVFIRKTVSENLLALGYTENVVRKANVEWATKDQARNYELFG